MTVLLDDRSFAIAEMRARGRRSPASLRDYLGSQSNERHREAALQLIVEFYDEAILRLRQMASGQVIEQNLTRGLLAVLEHVKTQPSPPVTLRFNPKWKVLPDAGPVEVSEREHQAGYAEIDSVIRQMIQNRGTAILETAEKFSEEQVLIVFGISCQASGDDRFGWFGWWERWCR